MSQSNLQNGRLNYEGRMWFFHWGVSLGWNWNYTSNPKVKFCQNGRKLLSPFVPFRSACSLISSFNISLQLQFFLEVHAQKMTPLLCLLLIVEINVFMVLLFRTRLRRLVMFVLDRVKEGRGPIMSTVAVTLFAVLMSSLYSIMRIQKRLMETGAVNPTDQILLSNHILDSSLMGTFSFLSVTLWS